VIGEEVLPKSDADWLRKNLRVLSSGVLRLEAIRRAAAAIRRVLALAGVAETRSGRRPRCDRRAGAVGELSQTTEVAPFVDHATPKGDPDLGGSYADTGGLRHVAALLEEQISEKISRRILSGDHGMIVWWSIGAGVHVEPHSHTNEQIVWMLKGRMEFRLGSEQRVCSQGDVVVIPGGAEHEAWFLEDTEVIDFFAPPRDDFLLGGKPTYMSEG
jgi:unsaturated pyranuronate lyase